MNVNTTNSYSTSAATNKGMSGLISGMDTESWVEQMLSGTQGKIDKQEQEKQKLIWQQLKYREIISDLNKFQESFFGSTSSTNLSSADFFNAMSVYSSSKAFSAIASPEAAMGNMSIRVGQLATASSVKSGAAVSNPLTGGKNIDVNAFKREVVFQTGSGEKKVTLSAADPKKSDEENLKTLVKELNDAGITAEIDSSGKLKMSGNFTVSSKSSALGMAMLGVTAGQKSGENGLTTTAVPDASVSFDLDLNGIKRTISLADYELSETSSLNEITKAIQSEIDKTFGSGWVTVGIDNGKFTLKTNGKGNVATISGNQSGLDLLGVQSGQSDKISRSQMLKDTNFKSALQGDRFEFTINGQKFSFSGDSTINDVIKTVNSSKAGVRLTYSDLEDKFTIESTETGAGREITMTQESGNLLNAMFGNVDGMKTGGTLMSKQLATGSATGSKELGSYPDSFEAGYFSFKVDGKSYSISIPSSGTSRDEVFKLINEGLANRFGYQADGKQNIELTGNKENGYSLSVRNGSIVTFEDSVKDTTDPDELKNIAAKNIHVAFGFNGASNVVKSADEEPAKRLIEELKNADVDGKFNISFEDGRIKMEAKNGGYAGINLSGELEKAFGTKYIRLGQTNTEGAGSAAVTKGQNAIAEINGVMVERSSNTFTTAGMTITLNEPTEKIPVLTKNGDGSWTDQDGNSYELKGGQLYEKGTDNLVAAYKNMKNLDIDEDGYIVHKDSGDKVIGGSTETITTSRNTDQIVDGMKNFVEKYNEMIDKLNTLIHEDATYRDYPPLTSAQKKEMSDREIELWEEKAQEGLYRNDSDISSFLQNMRMALYSKPEGSEYALYDIGIESSSEWRDYGKLEFNESKVRSMVESNPQAIQELFTNATDGLSTLMVNELKRTANTSSASAGTLVEKAGVPGKATNITNQMTQRLISINERIEELKKQYETEKTRYWRQFNTMEQALSNMNSQSSWLAMQFSY